MLTACLIQCDADAACGFKVAQGKILQFKRTGANSSSIRGKFEFVLRSAWARLGRSSLCVLWVCLFDPPKKGCVDCYLSDNSEFHADSSHLTHWCLVA